ncbi:MAG: tetratricopeptide repeat protein [candidate division Zixibacteria bacterium]|nr:tetratricopeptide repeat protein [candidate division Zixibacteria bacterium]
MLEYTISFLIALLIAVAGYLLYERFVRKSHKPTSSAYVEALCDLLDGRQESAFTKLRQVVAEDATNLDAYIRLGRILREHNQAERALQVHKDLTLRPDLTRDDRVAILHEIAADCLALDDVKTAESALSEQIALNSSDYWAFTRLLAIQEKARKWNDAYDTAVEILKLESNKSKKPLARYKYQSGRQLFGKREYHKARVLYKEAIGLDPSFVSAYLAIGDSYYEEKRYEDAVTFWKKLITSVPDQGHRVISRLKKTLFELGRFGDIQSICETILEHAPKNVEARRALAEFYEKKGDVDLAVELLEQVRDDHPDDNAVAYDLIRIYLERDDHTRIKKLIRNLGQRHDEAANSAPDGQPESSSSAASA